LFNKQVPNIVVKNETPKERLVRVKREEADRRAKELSQAASAQLK
jgi:hypothetical protein